MTTMSGVAPLTGRSKRSCLPAKMGHCWSGEVMLDTPPLLLKLLANKDEVPLVWGRHMFMPACFSPLPSSMLQMSR